MPWQQAKRPQAEVPRTEHQQHWKALIVLIPLRLGSDKLNLAYAHCLKLLLSTGALPGDHRGEAKALALLRWLSGGQTHPSGPALLPGDGGCESGKFLAELLSLQIAPQTEV